MIEMAESKAKSGKKSENGADGSEDSPKRNSSTPGNGQLHEEIVTELKRAYEMELETVINYLANSVHLDGILAQEIKESLKSDIDEELSHARQLAERLKILDADVPGSLSISFSQKSIQPPSDSTDVMSVIKGVIEAEESAIAQYEKLIELADDADDYVTEDLCVQLLGEEQHHKREFEGFLKSRERGTLK